MSDQLVAETATYTTDQHPCPQHILTRNPSKKATIDLRLTPHGNRDRL